MRVRAEGFPASVGHVEKQRIEAAADALYWARDSAELPRILAPLSPGERNEVWKKLDERTATDRAARRALLEFLHRRHIENSRENNQKAS